MALCTVGSDPDVQPQGQPKVQSVCKLPGRKWCCTEVWSPSVQIGFLTEHVCHTNNYIIAFCVFGYVLDIIVLDHSLT